MKESGALANGFGGLQGCAVVPHQAYNQPIHNCPAIV